MKTKKTKAKESPREKKMRKLSDKRSAFVTELFSKPHALRRKELEEKISELDEEYQRTM